METTRPLIGPNNRRHFIKQLSAGLILASSLPLFNCRGYGSKHYTIGIITGLISDYLEKDHISTLERIAELGYQSLEFSGFYGDSRDEYKKLLKELGLKPVAGGSAMSNIRESLDGMIEENLFFEKEYLICYWPWTDGGEDKTLDDYKRVAEEFNRIGEQCNAAGLSFAFHAHDREFYPIDGQIPYDIFVEETDPDLVSFELDIYWITKGNQDPVEYLNKYPGRFKLLHVKDMAPGEKRTFACVGDGIIDYKKVLDTALDTGVEHFIVERDRGPVDPMECAKRSINHLNSLGY